MDTIAYAVAYSEAAKRLLPNEGGRYKLVVPFYAMIASAIENALKAVLEFRQVPPNLKRWTRSHDLTALRLLAADVGFDLSQPLAEFIDTLSTPHKEHHFRYPQKAGVPHLPRPEPSWSMTEHLLRQVFDLIGGPARV